MHHFQPTNLKERIVDIEDLRKEGFKEIAEVPKGVKRKKNLKADNSVLSDSMSLIMRCMETSNKCSKKGRLQRSKESSKNGRQKSSKESSKTGRSNILKGSPKD